MSPLLPRLLNSAESAQRAPYTSRAGIFTARAGRPLGVDEADVVLRVLHRARHGGVTRPRVTAALEVVGVGQQRDRYPHAGDARGVGDFDLRDGLEAPPRVGFRRWLGGADETRSEAERGGGRRSERGLEKGATFHEISLGAIDAH